MILKGCVKLQNLYTEFKTEQEGEVASWLILAAGLAVAGVFASDTIETLINDLTNDVDSKARVNVG